MTMNVNVLNTNDISDIIIQLEGHLHPWRKFYFNYKMQCKRSPMNVKLVESNYVACMPQHY